MAFTPAPDCARVEFRMTLDSQLIENVCHFRFEAGPPGPADLGVLALACLTWWTSEYAPNIAAACVLREVVVTAITTDTGPQSTAPGGGAAGGVQQESEPNNVSFCITKRSASIGRSARGRWYVAGLPTTNITGNSLSDPAAIALTVAVRSLLLDNPPPGWEGVIVSTQHGGVPLATATIYPITAVLFRDNTVDSQRRRLPGRGT